MYLRLNRCNLGITFATVSSLWEEGASSFPKFFYTFRRFFMNKKVYLVFFSVVSFCFSTQAFKNSYPFILSSEAHNKKDDKYLQSQQEQLPSDSELVSGLVEMEKDEKRLIRKLNKIFAIKKEISATKKEIAELEALKEKFSNITPKSENNGLEFFLNPPTNNFYPLSSSEEKEIGEYFSGWGY